MPLVRKPAGANPSSRQPTSAVDVLNALRSSDKEERWAAARAAADIPGGAHALATALRAELDPRIREAIFTSLARVGSSESIATILELVRSDDAGFRAGALDALRTMGEAIRAHLPGLLHDEDSDVRLLSCELVRSLPSEQATQLLCDVLVRETEANVCAAAIEVLAEAGRPEALHALAQCEKKFEGAPFVMFAIKVARERIEVLSTTRHG